jgi:hypothetical protein
MDSLYSVNVPNKEYIELVNDIARMVTIQVTIQFLFFLNSPGEVDFFSADFILMIIYMILGICVYWLIIKKVLIFK